jgi:hypothetical protein
VTKAGLTQIGQYEANWERLSTAVSRVLRSA